MTILSFEQHSMSDTAPEISLEHALAALRQVRVSTFVEKSITVAALMGSNFDTQHNGDNPKKRRIDDLKKNTPCVGYGKIGHWLKYRRYFTQAMNEKVAHRQHNPVLRRSRRVLRARIPFRRSKYCPNPVIDEGALKSTGRWRARRTSAS